MSDGMRRPVETFSPKSSPRGARSPQVSRQDSTGTLKTTISLGKTPTIVHSGPFYLMKETPPESERTGAINLIVAEGLEKSYEKICLARKTKDSLSAFLSNLPGNIDQPASEDNSSLRALYERPPIGGKMLEPLTLNQLTGFRLHPGPLPEQYRFMTQVNPSKKNKKHKKSKSRSETPVNDLLGGDGPSSESAAHMADKKRRRDKKHEDEKERRKKKKDKKKKKAKHEPDPV